MSGSSKGTLAQQYLAEIAEAEAAKPRLTPQTRAAIEAISRGECPTEIVCDDPQRKRAQQLWLGHVVKIDNTSEVDDKEGVGIK